MPPRSTELIQLVNGTPYLLPRYGGNLNTARENFGLATIGGQEDKKVISFGGNGFDYLSSVEEWDEDTEEWKLAPYSLEESKDGDKDSIIGFNQHNLFGPTNNKLPHSQK